MAEYTSNAELAGDYFRLMLRYEDKPGGMVRARRGIEHCSRNIPEFYRRTGKLPRMLVAIKVKHGLELLLTYGLDGAKRIMDEHYNESLSNCSCFPKQKPEADNDNKWDDLFRLLESE